MTDLVTRAGNQVGRLRGRFDWRRYAIPLFVAGILIYLAAVPLIMLFVGSFQQEVAPREYVFTLSNYVAALTSPYTYSTFWTSMVFAGGAALVSFLIGTVLAWLVERTDVPFRRIIVPLAVVPLILPGILETIAWIFLLSPRIGYVNVALREVLDLGATEAIFDIFSMMGMIWVQAVGQVPLAFLLMVAAFRAMDPSLEESAMMSGASTAQTLRRVTFRLILPTSASVLLLMFVRALESFETPAIVGIPARIYTFTSEIYLAFTTFPPNYGLGSSLSVILLTLSVVGVWLYVRVTRNGERFQTITGKAFRPRRLDLGRWRWPAALLLLSYLIGVVVLPLLVIVWASFLPFFQAPSVEAFGKLSLANYEYLASFEPFHRALWNSVTLAVLSATGVMLITAVVAWVVYRTTLPGRKALDLIAFLPIAVPGLVLGMGLIIFYVSFPVGLYGTIWVLLIAYVTKYLPYGMRSASGSILQIHRELEEAANMSGAGWLQTFRRILIPLLRPGLVAGWIYICIVSFREFSTSILLATGESRVLSILAFQKFQQGETTEVAAMGVIMVTTILAIVAVFYRVTGRFGLQD